MRSLNRGSFRASPTHKFKLDRALVANTLDNTGSCLAKLERYDEAKEMLIQAREIRKKVLQEKHPLVAVSLDNLGLCQSYSGDIEEALNNFQEALEIRRGCYEEDHPLIKLSLSYIETCEKVISISASPINSPGQNEPCLLSKNEFEALIEYARDYICHLDVNAQKVLEKNPSGFVRLRLPVPQEFSHRIETLRLNFWIPEVKIMVVEAAHNHPRYFESMIIKGGYTHRLYKEQTNSTADTTMHIASRIFKSNHLDRRNIFSIGKIHLEPIDVAEVKKGAMIAFPGSIIHQVLLTNEGTLTINCVFKKKKTELITMSLCQRRALKIRKWIEMY